MNQQLEIQITVAWWLRWYLAGVLVMSRLTGLEPDLERVQAVVMRAIRFT